MREEAGQIYAQITASFDPSRSVVWRSVHKSPLVRLGLLDPVRDPDQRLIVSALGKATWRRFLDRGGQFPEDLTNPSR